MDSQAFFRTTRGSLLFVECTVAVCLQQRFKDSADIDIYIYVGVDWVSRCWITFVNGLFSFKGLFGFNYGDKHGTVQLY